MRLGTLFLFLVLAGFAATPTEAVLATFDTPVVTGATSAPGVWYTDRYAPAGFSSPVFFDGDNRLMHSISAADSANSRPSSFASSFYNTQGRKLDLAPNSVSLSIDLYIPSDWATTGNRMAGLWGTAFDATNSISAYPIVEFTSDGADPRFQGWDLSGDWIDLGLPTGFAYDEWYTLGIDLSGGGFNYSVGDATASVSSPSSSYVGNTILQGYNTDLGVSYDIYWDNLNVQAIPEPTAVLFGSLIAGGLGLTVARRRREEG